MIGDICLNANIGTKYIHCAVERACCALSISTDHNTMIKKTKVNMMAMKILILEVFMYENVTSVMILGHFEVLNLQQFPIYAMVIVAPRVLLLAWS